MNNARVSEETSINSIPISHAEQVEEIKLRQMESPLLLLETRLEDKALGQAVKWAETRRTCPWADTCWTRVGLHRQDFQYRETLCSLGRLTLKRKQQS